MKTKPIHRHRLSGRIVTADYAGANPRLAAAEEVPTKKAEGDYAWCLHCERTYTAAEKEAQGDCPYSDCDGSTFMDGWPWSKVRSINPDYPAEPKRGKVYHLYGKPQQGVDKWPPKA